MTEFNGILIDEKILSDLLTAASILIPVITAAFLALLWLPWRIKKETPEEKAKIEKSRLLIHHLKKTADSDPYVAKKLLKERHKYRKLMDKRIQHITRWVLTGAILLGAVLSIWLEWLPKYQDSVHKDYATYSGTFEVYYDPGRSNEGWVVILPDGTWLNANSIEHDYELPDEGLYNGTVVYTSRSDVALGVEWK